MHTVPAEWVSVLAPVLIAASVAAQADWHLESTRPRPHAGAAGCVDPVGGRLLIFGGQRVNESANDDMWEWRPGSGWRELEPATRPPARTEARMAYDRERGVAVMFGGRSGTWANDETWLFDGLDWRRVDTAHAPLPRSAVALAWDPVRRQVLLFGGTNLWSQPTVDTWAFDGSDWIQLAPATVPSWPAPGTDYQMVTDDAGGRVLLVGGERVDARGALDLWQWDGVDWMQLPARGPSQRRGHRVAARDGSIVLHGGRHLTDLDDTWVFDGTRWHAGDPTGLPRSHHLLLPSPDGQEFHLFGGGIPGSPARLGEFRFDGRWRESPGSVPGELSKPAAGVGAGGALVVGSDLVTGEAHTYLYRSGGWERVVTPNAPTMRFDAAVAHDPQRDEWVLFGGGLYRTALDDTWVFDGHDWAERTTATRPPGRGGHAMIWDAARQRIVLFGGMVTGVGNQLDDTWEWDGSGWQPLASALRPTARRDHRLAFDVLRGRPLLFGGWVDDVGFGDDTWELGPNGWTPLDLPVRPPGRSLHAMGWDATRECIVVFGGRGGASGWFDDTWELTSEWRRRTTQRAPLPVQNALLAFQPASGELLLSGGDDIRREVFGQIWRFAARPQATAEPYGRSCQGAAAAAPMLAATRPWLGMPMTVTARDVPPGAPAALSIGVGRVRLGLEGAGMPGCASWTLPFASAGMLTSGTTAAYVTPLPADASLAGVQLNLQAIVFAPGANAAGALTTNGVEITAALR